MKTDIKLFIAVIVILLAVTFILHICQGDNKDNTKLVNLNETINLLKNQTVKLKNEDVRVTVTGFIYSPCPKGSNCIWSGLAVNYELYVDGKIVNNTKSDYKVVIIKSNYKTYASIKIVKKK